MKKIVAFVLLNLNFLFCFGQSEKNLKSYYEDQTIFRVDSVYQEVMVDDQIYTFKILSNLLDDNLHPYQPVEEYWEDLSPKTMLIYDQQGNLVFASTYKHACPTIYKVNRPLNATGPLYLQWFNFGGGSGYLVELWRINKEGDLFEIEEVLEYTELSHVYYHKNGKELLVLNGVWDFEAEESHFEDHRVTTNWYTREEDSYSSVSFPLSKQKYPVEEVDAMQILQNFVKNEKLFPTEFNPNDWESMNFW